MTDYEEVQSKLSPAFLARLQRIHDEAQAEYVPILMPDQIVDGFEHRFDQPAASGLTLHLQKKGQVFPHPQNFKSVTVYRTALTKFLDTHRDELSKGTPGEQSAATMDRDFLRGLAWLIWTRWYGEQEIKW